MRKLAFAAVLALTVVAFAPPVPAQGPPKGTGGYCCGAEKTPGWGMMTPEERKAHESRLSGFKDSQSCMAYMDEHHKAMEERARQRGTKMGKDPGPHCGHVGRKN